MHDPEEDIKLIAKIAEGDLRSFEAFYERHSGVLFSTAYKVLNNQADAEDVTQDVFMQIWEKARLFDPARGKPLTWAITLTRNKAIDRVRSLQRRLRLKDQVEQEYSPNETTQDRQPFDDVDAGELGVLVREAIAKLSTEQREAIEMAFFSGLTQQEVADRLGEPLGTVKARIRRGMIKLRDSIGRRI